jgi:1-hydroxycarotenoid 3,4-desaturase
MGLSKRRVVVVGAGIGGLSATLELAARGVEVVLVEAAATPGGKMREVNVAGRLQDAGPTVFTMRWVFEELFAAAGTSLGNELTLRPVHTLARHAWTGPAGDVQQLDLFADLARSADAIGQFAGPKEARGYLDFCARAQSIYRTLEQPFLRASRPNPVSLTHRIGLRGLPDLWRIAPFSTLWAALGEHFQDPRLLQLFGRYATYCGASPFLAPATLMMVAHVEQSGVWLVDGGMHRVAQAIAARARHHGAQLRFSSPVARILVRQGRVCGVKLASVDHPNDRHAEDGEEIEADSVIFNGDVSALAQGLLGDGVKAAAPPTRPAQRSLSAITWNLVARTQGFPLLRHTVFFSADYRAEFDDLQRRGHVPTDPTVYLCAHDRGDTDQAISGVPERLLCLINAPAHGDHHPLTPAQLQAAEARTFARLEASGLKIERQTDLGEERASGQSALMTTPSDFHRLFPATGGALYGRASHGWQASFSRPGARTALPGLYLAGGSTHPGPGVPMAALSGRQAVASWWADQARGAPA